MFVVMVFMAMSVMLMTMLMTFMAMLVMMTMSYRLIDISFIIIPIIVISSSIWTCTPS